MPKSYLTACTRYNLCNFVKAIKDIIAEDKDKLADLEQQDYRLWPKFRTGYLRGQSRQLEDSIKSLTDLLAALEDSKQPMRREKSEWLHLQQSSKG